jgi:hypothetical protein
METFIKQPFTPLQLELLKIFAMDIPESDLLEIKSLLIQYFANKAMDLADGVWDQNNWNEDDENRLLNEHCRTSKKTDPMTMNEFNKMIDKSEEDFKNGRVKEAKELLKIVETWK